MKTKAVPPEAPPSRQYSWAERQARENERLRSCAENAKEDFERIAEITGGEAREIATTAAQNIKTWLEALES